MSDEHVGARKRSRACALQREGVQQIQGLTVTPAWLTVPLDHEKPEGAKIKVFAREVIASSRKNSTAPYLCFFQGGPGCPSPAPDDSLEWLNFAVKHFRVILLDQRGTGKSSPVRPTVLASKGSVQEQAAYLKHFRADSIVKDAECLRKELLQESEPWAILGQSFGGFCCVEYLSKYPSGISECLMTGGMPSKIDQPCAAEAVYMATFQRVATQNEKFYGRFPGDVEKVKEIARYLKQQPGGGIRTPKGNWLSPRSMQILGMSALGGGGPGVGFERLHFLIDSALDTCCDPPELTPTFVKAFDASIPFDTAPLYALLHEACYSRGGATKWAAQRVRDTHYSQMFDAEANAEPGAPPVYFAGEMVFPWMFEDFACLQPFKEVAEVLAHDDDWSSLYDKLQLLLNKVPTAAAVYVEDMYVDFVLSQETVKCINGIRTWVTNEYQHSGIRDDGSAILERLLSMTRGNYVNF